MAGQEWYRSYGGASGNAEYGRQAAFMSANYLVDDGDTGGNENFRF